MAKLTLPESAYKGIPNAKKCEKMTSPEYDNLAEEATKRIRKHRLEQARVYAEAERYFCDQKKEEAQFFLFLYYISTQLHIFKSFL